MVCSYLLYDHIFDSAKDALQFFATPRTRNGVGVVISSQRRYVQYYEHMVKNDFTYFPNVVFLESLKFIGNPCIQGASCSPHFTIKIQKVKTYSSKDYDYIRRSGNTTEFLLQQHCYYPEIYITVEFIINQIWWQRKDVYILLQYIFC